MTQIASTLFAYLAFALALVLWLPAMALTRLATLPFDPQRRVVGRLFRWLGVIAGWLCPLWHMRVKLAPGLPEGPFVAVANHESLIDTFLLSRLPREMKWLGKESVFRTPWVGWMMRLAGDIPVRRGDRASGARALQAAARYLARGMPVMIFPEGTRSRDGSVGPFKGGAFRLAIATGAPIVPIALSGTGEGMPVGSPWLRRARPVAQVLDPIPTAGLTEADVHRLADEVRERIGQARAALRQAADSVREGPWMSTST